MPVAAPRSEEAELDGNIGKPRPQVGIVAWVPSLDRVQALSLESFNDLAGTAFLQVRDRDHTSAGMDNGCHLGKAGQRLLHERRAAPSNQPVEGIVGVGGPAMTDQRAS